MAKKKKNEAIVLFSGGKDSFLTTCMLIEKGYKVNMVNFKTVASIGDSNVSIGAKRIIEKYGTEKVKFLGIFSIVGIWRELVLPFLNMTQEQILQEYGNITYSQFNCLTCRSAMYIWCAIKAKKINVSCIADGARKIQGFVIELPIMVNVFEKFFKNLNIEFICPILNLKSDWTLKNMLLARGFVPKTSEGQCLLGAPLIDGNPDKDVQKAVLACFQKLVLPKAKKLINNNFSIEAQGEYL